jgi:hypothetical protein
MSSTVVRPSFAARLTGYEAIEEVIIPRDLIRHRESTRGQQVPRKRHDDYGPEISASDRHSVRKTVGPMKTKIAISAICVLLGTGHLIWPNVNIDLVIVVLLAVAILPWLAEVIRSVEFPGGFKIELQDVKAATEKVTGSRAATAEYSIACSESVTATEKVTVSRAATVGPPTTPAREENLEFLREVARGDPNLALVGLRIEIERRLSQLAQLAQLPAARRSAGVMLRDLVAHEQVDRQTAAGLGDLIALGNQAAHGAEVSSNAATWALDTGPLILEMLDSLLARSRNMQGAG